MELAVCMCVCGGEWHCVCVLGVGEWGGGVKLTLEAEQVPCSRPGQSREHAGRSGKSSQFLDHSLENR